VILKDNRYSRAFVLVLFALVVFSAFFLLKASEQGYIPLIITAIFMVFICFFVVVMHGQKLASNEGFSIPFTLFLANTLRCLLTGDYSDYYSLCLVISCLGALFLNKKAFVRFLLVSNLIIALEIIFHIPMLIMEQGAESRIEMAMLDKLYGWFISLIGSISVYVVTTFAEDKNNDASKAKNFFVGALSSTPDPMILLDAQNRVTYISSSFMKILRLERASHAKGRPVFDLIKDKNLKDLFYELLTKGDSSQTTREVILDGQQYFFEIVVSKFAQSKGYFVNIVNITPVMKARFEAEAASRSKSQFLATMSHEIRTPLNAIIGLSDVELQKNLPADTRINLEKVYNSGRNLLSIINDILDISKIETGNFKLIPVDYDTPSLINDTVQLNIVRIGSKKITFKLNLDESIPHRLFGDELRIKQILTNLLSNAFKYTEEGKVSLTVRWEKRGENAWMIFAVQDTGQGIKKEDLNRLFSEYHQLDAQANRHIEGTGLGLSITKNLVLLMDGKINVESEYGKGSTFTVQFPQRIVEDSPIGKEITQNLEAFRFKDIFHTQSLRLVRSYMPYGKVLVVDDVETNLDVAKGLLLPYGLSIDTASSGTEAIEKVKTAGNEGSASRYDLIFMDHMMPGMDGIETVRIIRNELPGNYGRMVPIIALTANALAGNEKMFLANGFNAFIPKPVDVIQLDTALNTWVRNKQSPETLKMAEIEMTKLTKNDENTSGVLDSAPVTGIDFTQGIERYNGEAAYLDILRSWCKHTPTLLDKMKELSPENLAEYSITVHGLKGSSYGILANDIGKRAQELEGFAKAGDFKSVQANNADFIAMTESVLVELGALLEKASTAKGVKPKMALPDTTRLSRLLAAAKRYKSTAMEEILEELESYDYESGGELIVWLREQIDNLEYDAICSRLEGTDTPQDTP
jgi:signal transduction histidine kinase/CheY-like chemotaxis protein